MRSRLRDPRPRGARALACARSLELNEAGGEGFEDWDLASAQQGIAHAHLASGDRRRRGDGPGAPRESLVRIEDAEDRELIESQIAELGL